MARLKVIYCGTPDFSLPVLEMLFYHPNIDLRHVVTMPDRKSGRGQELHSPPVATFSKNEKIPLLQTENINKESEFLEQIKKEEIDTIIVLAFAQFLSEKVLSIPKLGCFNIHTSLLPKYRGAAPIQHALLNGEISSGVTIQKMVKQMDAGDLVHTSVLFIAPNETAEQLSTRLKFLAALSVNDFVSELVSKKLKFTPQNHDNASFAPTLQKNDGAINFKMKSVSQIKNMVRALNPWPGTFCLLNGKRLKIIEVIEEQTKLKPGEVFTKYNSLLIGCIDGTLRILRVQAEGKKICSDSDFLNGNKANSYEVSI